MNIKSVVLCILDGWGNEIIEKNSEYNAIKNAKPPFWEYIINSNYPKCSLSACGTDVGLPNGQIGNSEVGHMNIGSGRIVMQSLQRINHKIRTIESNINLKNFVRDLKNKQGSCHIMGLISEGGVHSHQKHISILANIISNYEIKVLVHAFLDGRDTLPNSGKQYIQKFKESINNNIKIVTISGRHYSMDRDNRWERTIKSYEAIAFANAPCYNDLISFINNNYQNGITDEFIKPAVTVNYKGIKSKDGVLLANFRADRMIQLASILLGKKTDYTKVAKFSSILSMMQYKSDLKIPCLFTPECFTNTLGEVISNNKLRQLRIAETEKYAHVTFFFNCGKEKPFAGEERILIPSPKIETYDLQPEMSAFELTKKLIDKIYSKKFALIVVNYANPDILGHSGKVEAAKKAILAIDNCLMKVFNAVKKVGETTLIITSDHGNVECMFDKEKNVPYTAHTLNTVPFVICFNFSNNINLRDGRLSDIAPTILQLLGIEIPKEITGNSLIV